jgi:hypothetical protein
MPIPEGIHFDPSGTTRYYDETGKSVGFHSDILKQPEYHDWMKTYAQNLKKVMPEGAILVPGAQELIDAPTYADGNTALSRYLEGKYPGKFVNPRLRAIIPDGEGILDFVHGDGQLGKVMRSSIDENLARATSPALAAEVASSAPIAKIATREAEQVSAKIVSSMPSVSRGALEAGAKKLVRVPKTAVMSQKTLSNLLQSAVTATKIMR